MLGSGKEHPLDEPERAGGDDHDRPGKRHLAAGHLAARPDRSQRRRDGDHHQQLAELHAEVERKQRPAQRARRQVHLAQHVREAEAVDEAERERDPGAHVAAAPRQQVVGADVDDAQRNRRFDDPCRRADDVQGGERQRDAVRQGERSDDDEELADGSAEQQQADQEQQMVRADRGCGVRRPEWIGGPPPPRPAGCPSYSKLGRPRSRMACVSAAPLYTLTNVWWFGSVREHRRGDQQPASRRGQLVPNHEPEWLSVRQDIGHRRPAGGQRPAVGGQREPRPQHRHDRGGPWSDDVGFEELFRRVEVEIVSDVEDMRDEA